MAKRGPKAGEEAVQRLQALITTRQETGEGLPLNGAALHLGQICTLVGVARSTVHQNPAFRAILEAYAQDAGVAFSIAGVAANPTPPPSAGSAPTHDETKALHKRIHNLEARVHELTARNGDLLTRNADLLARLQACAHMEHTFSTKGSRRA